MMNEQRTSWQEHWTNGGLGVSKVPDDKLPLVEAAIKELGDVNLYVF